MLLAEKTPERAGADDCDVVAMVVFLFSTSSAARGPYRSEAFWGLQGKVVDRHMDLRCALSETSSRVKGRYRFALYRKVMNGDMDPALRLSLILCGFR
jgi:hypothetical protein